MLLLILLVLIGSYRKKIIGLRLIEVKHTGENIAERVAFVVQEFSLIDKFFSVTLDNASSNAKGPVHFSYNPYFLACFLVGRVFFSHNKSAGTVFWLVFSAKRTGP